MDIKKKYHFYAAHRNELLKDKCRNIHGHTYHVDITFSFPIVQADSGVCWYDGKPMLFSEIDKIVDVVIGHLDHCLLIHVKDPLLGYLENFCEAVDEGLKMHVMSVPTSAENLAKDIFITLSNVLPIKLIELRETESSTVIYNGK